jgi:ABC-type phosphate transport system, periplasmic component
VTELGENLDNKMMMLLTVAVTAVVCIAGTAVVMGSNSEDNVTINVAGSTTVQPLMVRFQESFEDNTNAQLNVSGGGSGAGVSTVQNGSADIGMLSRDLKPSETGFKVTVIANDGVSIIVNKAVRDAGVTNVTLEQIKQIYEGSITNWNQLGASTSIAIKPIMREEGSGTRACLEELTGLTAASYPTGLNAYQESNSTGNMSTSVGSTTGAVGYVGYATVAEMKANPSSVNFRDLDVGSVTISEDAINDGTYKLARQLILITDENKSNSAVDFFLNWILSAQGQKIVKDGGFLPIGPIA